MKTLSMVFKAFGVLAISLLTLLAVVTPASAATARAEPAAAERFAAPTARPTACGGFPCVVFSRGETAQIALGGPGAAIGFAAVACGLLPPPFSVVCAGGAVVYGPVLANLAVQARLRGRCVGLQARPVGATVSINPVVANC